MLSWGPIRRGRIGRPGFRHLGTWLYAGTTRLVAGAIPLTASAGTSSDALSAPTITRTSGVTTYPPTFDIARPIDWQDGDFLLTRWSTDLTFATGVNEGTPVVLAAATTTITVGISAVVSGTYYIESAAFHSARPVSLNWSNIIGVGDNTTPTITSANSFSGYQFVAGTFALTASKPGTWAIVGGSYQDQFSLSGSTLAWDAQSLAVSLDVQVQFTDYFGNTSTIQTITGTIAANTPSAFSFTDLTNAALSTLETSNTITIAGLVGGASVPISISGTGAQYSKNGGAYTSATGTCINGDTITLQATSPSANNGTATIVFTAGVTSDTWTIATPVVLTTTTTWNPADKAASITLSAANMTATGTVQGTNAMVRSSTGKSTGKRYAELAAAMLNGVGFIGIADGTESLSNYVGQTVHSTGYESNGNLTNCNTGTATAYNDNNNHIVGLAIDCDAGTFDIYLDNVLQGHGPNNGNGPLTAPIYLAMSAQWTSTAATLNTGHSAWVYGPPTGYMAWDV